MGHADSIFPEGVKVLRHKPQIDPIASELRHYQSYQYLLRTFDVIHDFSHLHLASRFNSNLPSLNIFWHAPAIARYPKAPYNIIGLSQWACREFRRIYHQEAKYQQSILIDPEVYYPDKPSQRNERFLSIGIMTPEKGHLIALQLCLQAGVPLDVAGGRGMGRKPNEPLNEYEQNVQTLAQTPPNQFLGEVDDKVKVILMQTCKALIYATPLGYAEVTSHKIIEALFCGCPIITTSSGAMPEIVTHGIDGFLCRTDAEYLDAIKNVDKLDPSKTHEEVVRKYEIKNVIAQYVELYQKVKEGLRW